MPATTRRMRNNDAASSESQAEDESRENQHEL